MEVVKLERGHLWVHIKIGGRTNYSYNGSRDKEDWGSKTLSRDGIGLWGKLGGTEKGYWGQKNKRGWYMEVGEAREQFMNSQTKDV